MFCMFIQIESVASKERTEHDQIDNAVNEALDDIHGDNIVAHHRKSEMEIEQVKQLVAI